MLKCICTISVLLISIQFSHAQEIVSGLLSNKVVVNEYNKQTSLKSGGGQNIDTLDLPFFDDFSFSKTYPSDSLWIGKDVFVNSNYGKEMPTVGVATFDAINEQGFLHDGASIKTFAGDTLTSMPIKLKPEYFFIFDNGSDTANDVPIWKLSYFNTCLNDYFLFDSLYIRNIDIVKENDSIISIDTSWTLANELNLYNIDDTLFSISSCDTFMVDDSLFYFYSNDTFKVHRSDLERIPWNVNDSVVLSFMVQAGGYGDMPEPTDSFAIQLYAPIEKIWFGSAAFSFKTSDPEFIANPDTFLTVAIPISSSEYLQNGFQFRFINYATLTDDNTVPGRIGNCDHWNLDFVYLDRSRRSDTIAIQDVAQAKPLRKLLNNYYSMPVSHFMNSPRKLSMLNIIQSIDVRNFNNEIAPDTRYRYQLWDKTNDVMIKEFPNEIILDSLFAFSTDTRTDTLVYSFPDTATGDFVHFEIKSFLSTDVTQLFPSNDTVSFVQMFRNYYSYDDGTAENGYGLTGSGINNAKVAVAFKLEQEDTLKAVQIYFNVANDEVNLDYLQMAVWQGEYDPVEEVAKPIDTLGPLFVFEEVEAIHDNLNLFHEFVVPTDTLLIVSDWLCVGWIQSNETYLNVGLDQNFSAKSRTFYNITGEWKQSNVDGVVMVRPVFGELLPLNIEKPKPQEYDVLIYPNPAHDYFNLEWPVELFNKQVVISIYNTTGRLVYSASEPVEHIDTFNWENGMYIVRITDGCTFNLTKKVIITP